MLVALCSLLFFAASAQDMSGMKMPAKKEAAAPTSKTIYTCPMDPEVRSDKPGKCPKCGMDLVKKKVKVAAQKPAVPKHDHSTMHGANETPVKAEDHEEKAETQHTDMPMHSPAADSSEDVQLPGGKVDMSPGKTVRYDLYVTDTMVNYTGKKKHAFAINGTLPGPDLVFTEGDTAAIYVYNKAQHETSIHWHGVILPNEFDGVPYLTTQPIRIRAKRTCTICCSSKRHLLVSFAQRIAGTGGRLWRFDF